MPLYVVGHGWRKRFNQDDFALARAFAQSFYKHTRCSQESVSSVARAVCESRAEMPRAYITHAIAFSRVANMFYQALEDQELGSNYESAVSGHTEPIREASLFDEVALPIASVDPWSIRLLRW